MEAPTAAISSFTPKPISELMPGFSGVLTDKAILTTAKKQPRSRATIAQTRTAVKDFKPMTLAEMKNELLTIKPSSPKQGGHMPPSSKKRGWNSSVKVDKRMSHTAGGTFKSSDARKVLNFQQKPVNGPVPRMTMSAYSNNPSIKAAETPKFPKPQARPKKALNVLQAKSNVRISGIYNIPPTPVEQNKPARSRMTIANKENFVRMMNKVHPSKPSHAPNIQSVAPMPPPSRVTMVPQYRPVTRVTAPTPQIKMVTPLPETPASNSSWKSGSDASFLQKEKEIHEAEEKINAFAEEKTLEKISEVSPPMSTPFKEYRSVQEYFNNSSCLENSELYNDNTIMCFDKPSVCNENEKKEESVILSLCEFLKATVINTNTCDAELDNLLQLEKQTEQSIKMLKSCIIAQEKSLKNVRKLIKKKQIECKRSESERDKTLVAEAKDKDMDITMGSEETSPEKSPILSKPCSVIKSSKSPSYRIPKKNSCIRKKVICKSMNVSKEAVTPVKEMDGRALDMYMQMKEQMYFLRTPKAPRTPPACRPPDTPSLTSHNLQKQLDKLFTS